MGGKHYFEEQIAFVFLPPVRRIRLACPGSARSLNPMLASVSPFAVFQGHQESATRTSIPEVTTRTAGRRWRGGPVAF